jgi:hypothetical protein
MHHLIVKRVAFLLVTLLVVIIVLFGIFIS